MPSTFVDQTEAIFGYLDERNDEALALHQQFVALVNTFETTLNSQLAVLATLAPNYALTGVDTTYAGKTVPNAGSIGVDPNYNAPSIPAPGAAGVDTTYIAPTIPSADGITISDANWNAIYLRAQGLQDRIKNRQLRKATIRASLRGHEEWDENTSILTDEANETDEQQKSANALASAFDQQQAEREDVIRLIQATVQSEAARVGYEQLALREVVELVQQNITSEGTRNAFERLGLDEVIQLIQASIGSEQARLGYETLELDKQFRPETESARFALERTSLAITQETTHLLDLIQVYAQVTNAFLSAAPVGARTSTGISLSGDA